MPKKTEFPGDPAEKKDKTTAGANVKKTGHAGISNGEKFQEIANIDNFWKVETVIWSRMKVVKVKDDDFGTMRYFRIFYRQLADSPKEKKDFIAFNICDHFFNDDDHQFKEQLGLPQDDAEYVLKTAQKCEPEVYNYFKNAFPSEVPPEDSNTLSIDSNADPLLTNREGEKILDLIHSHVVQLQPVKTTISELTPEQYREYRDHLENNNIISFPVRVKA